MDFTLEVLEGKTEATNRELVVIQSALDQPLEGEGQPSQLELRELLRDLFQAREAALDPDLTISSARNDSILADLFEYGGRREAALDLLRDTAERYPESNPYLPLLLTQLGDFTRDSGNVGEAKDVLERARSILDRVESSYRVSRPYVELTLGQVYLEMGMTDVAYDPITSGFEAADSDELADASLWGTGYFRRINLAHNSEQFDWQFELWQEYCQKLEESRKRAEEGDESAWRHYVPAKTHAAIALNTALGRVEQEFRDPELESTASGLITEVLALEGIVHEQRFRGTLWSAVSALDRGEAEEARAAVEEARKLLAKIDGGLTQQELELSAVEMRLFSESSGAEERAVAVANLDRSWSAFLADWRASDPRSGGVSFLQYGRRKAIVDAVFARYIGGEGGSPTRALEAWLELQSLGSLARQAGIKSPVVAELKKGLEKSGKGLVLWVPGRVSSHALCVDGERVTYHPLPPSHLLDAESRLLAGDVASVLRSPTPNNAKAMEVHLQRATELFVPKDLRARMEEFDALVLLGTSDFGFLPFEALGDSVGEFGRRWPVETWPSIPVGTWLQREASDVERADRWLILGGDGETDPEMRGAKRYPELFLDRADLTGPARQSKHEAELRLAAESGRAVMSSWSSAEVLHIVAHGFYDGYRERPAGLLLDPGNGASGAVFSEAIEEMKGLPPLVLLTACGSDRARPRRGDDGRARLTGAFFSAGSRAVITSSTDLELTASLAFLNEVGLALGKGETVARAMWIARRAEESNVEGVHPVHACLMQVHGNGDLQIAGQ